MPWPPTAVDRGAPVRVLSVAQGLETLGLDREVLGQIALIGEALFGELCGDVTVVGRGVHEGARGEVAPLREGRTARAERLDDRGVRLGRDDDRDVGEFFAEARTIAGPPMSIFA